MQPSVITTRTIAQSQFLEYRECQLPVTRIRHQYSLATNPKAPSWLTYKCLLNVIGEEHVPNVRLQMRCVVELGHSCRNQRPGVTEWRRISPPHKSQ